MTTPHRAPYTASNPWLRFWLEALAAPLGVRIRTHDPVTVKTALYNAKARAHDPSLEHLQIRTPPPPCDPQRELWIVNPPPPPVHDAQETDG